MGKVLRAKSRGRAGISEAGVRMLQRIAAAQQSAGASSVRIEDLISAPAQWYTLQGLLGRVLVSKPADGRIRLTAGGWRLVRAIHGRG